MKRTKTILLMVLGLSAGLNTFAQTIVSGTNLNIGTSNTLDGNRGNAIGTGHWLGGHHSLAVGNNDTILSNSNSSISLGSSNKIGGLMSMAIGTSITTNGTNRCIGIGHDLRLSGNSNCITIGSGIIGSETNPSVPLNNNHENCLMIGMNSTKPTLTVGPSPNDYPYGNLVSNRTGKIAIGNIPVSDIAAKLHIRADEGEDAGIFLQPTGKNGEISFIRMTDNSHQIDVGADGAMRITSGNNNLAITSANANLSETGLVLGCNNTPILNLTADASPAIYSNAYRSGNSCRRYMQGPSYAIEFNSGSLLFRTAENQEPRGTEITNWRDQLQLKPNGNIVLNGKVGINRENTTTSYALAVDGGLITTEVYVMETNNWPDYVFGAEYKLMSLDELKCFVANNKHLPNLPSAKEIHEQGYNMGEMQELLLQKIEELTLYILQQENRITQLEQQLYKHY